MKIAVLIARILLGLMFVVFGLNGFLNFIHGPMPTGTAGQFMGAIASTHYFHVVAIVQLLGGLLLLSGQFIPLALVLLGPVIFNILVFHATMQPAGLPPGLVAFLLWLVVFYPVRQAFTGIFVRKVESPA
jgi:putative oxidoreductase